MGRIFKMKTAVLLSGHTREALSCWNSLRKNIIEPTNADVYMHSYHSDNIEDVIETIKPKKFILEDESSVVLDKNYNTEMPHYLSYITNPIISVYMFRKIKLCYDLLEGNYDTVIKTRFDCKYTEEFPILDIDKYNIPNGGDFENGIFDMVCASSQENMKYYCSIYDEIENYLDEGIPLHSELLLKRHLESKIINRFEYTVVLRKVFDKPWVEDKIFTVK
jgi:hypothetical protein